MISPPRNRVGTVADAVSRSDLLPRADSGAVLREHELRVVRCRYPLCPRRDCHPKGASAFGPPIRRIAPGKCHSAPILSYERQVQLASIAAALLVDMASCAVSRSFAKSSLAM